MPVTLEQLRALVDDPREILSVEVKNWLNLSEKADQSNLAKAVISIANSGGGFVVLGFDELDDGSFEESQPHPGALAAYSQDAIASIVATYADPSFQVEVRHLARTGSGLVYPLVIVRGGHQTPILAKRGSPDNKSLVVGRVYIRRPKPESAEPTTVIEWRDLLDRCIRARMKALGDAGPSPYFELTLQSAAEGPIPASISQRDTDLNVETLAQIKVKTPLLHIPAESPLRVVRRSSSMSMFYDDPAIPPAKWSREEIERYNTQVTYYYREYETYLEKLAEFYRQSLRTVHVELRLENIGTRPGTGIDVEVDIPAGLILFRADRLPTAPARPYPPPKRPTPQRFATVRHVPDEVSPLIRSSSSHWTDIDVERQRIRFHLAELKHGYGVASDAFALIFASSQDIGPVELTFQVSANELPVAQEDCLRLDVEREQE